MKLAEEERKVKATVEDQKKHDHLLGYLEGTITHCFIIRPVNNVQVHAYIDAAFVFHYVSKWHTGVAIAINQTVICTASWKKAVTKSLTKAKIVGLTENECLVKLFHEFLSFIVKRLTCIPIIHQDSVGSLATQRGSI